jgi:hypothetical protein
MAEAFTQEGTERPLSDIDSQAGWNNASERERLGENRNQFATGNDGNIRWFAFVKAIEQVIALNRSQAGSPK